MATFVFPEDVAVDVLIVGAGPAGYMAAATLARYSVDFRVIDQRAETIQGGQASGVQPRTQEVLQTLDLQYTLDIKGNHVSEAAFWTANAENDNLERTHVGRECIHPTRYPWILGVPQRETEKAFDRDLTARGHHVDRPTQLLHFSYTDDPDYPIHALVKHLFTNVTSEYRCKYLIGGDGAGSVTRRLLGISSDSNDPEDFWVVADLELETDFPDQRRRCHVRTPAGAMMMIPCGGGVNRIYTQLSPAELASLGGVDRQSAKSDSILMASEGKDAELLNVLKTRVKSVLQPYTSEVKRLQWISQYRIKQRIIDSFYDGARVFVMGDACHTHSPKAAQGLNISMMDAYNLTWKLALVLQGKLQPQILETYNSERLQIAKELIGFDRKIANLYIKKEFLDKNAELTSAYYEAHGFTSGVGLQYSPNPLVKHDMIIPIVPGSLEPLAPGKRLLAPTVTRHVDGTVVNILDEMPSNGRFHLFIFAGNAISQRRLAPCADYLNSSSSILHRYSSSATNKHQEWAFEDIRTTSPKNRGRTVDLFLIHSDNLYDFHATDLPAPLPNWKYRVYADDGGREHWDHGVDPGFGAMVLVRPDGFIGLVTGLDGSLAMTEFMDQFMIVADQSVNRYDDPNGHASESRRVYINGTSGVGTHA
ncbi:MAG: hypothetical protein LQ342_006695 [Letrouitia transgressa]|nr:MAG: hypothetical protein LQ342_006695 [Letrouitia transgressa]